MEDLQFYHDPVENRFLSKDYQLITGHRRLACARRTSPAKVHSLSTGGPSMLLKQKKGSPFPAGRVEAREKLFFVTRYSDRAVQSIRFFVWSGCEQKSISWACRFAPFSEMEPAESIDLKIPGRGLSYSGWR